MGSLVSVDPRHPTPVYVQLEHGCGRDMRTGRHDARRPASDGAPMAVDLRLDAKHGGAGVLELERTGSWRSGAASARSSPTRRSTKKS
jgi:hypothetical protein